MKEEKTNVVDKHWLSNKQVLGLSGILIAMGISYGEFQTMKSRRATIVRKLSENYVWFSVNNIDDLKIAVALNI